MVFAVVSVRAPSQEQWPDGGYGVGERLGYQVVGIRPARKWDGTVLSQSRVFPSYELAAAEARRRRRSHARLEKRRQKRTQTRRRSATSPKARAR